MDDEESKFEGINRAKWVNRRLSEEQDLQELRVAGRPGDFCVIGVRRAHSFEALLHSFIAPPGPRHASSLCYGLVRSR